jgi:hypothetical protein
MGEGDMRILLAGWSLGWFPLVPSCFAYVEVYIQYRWEDKGIGDLPIFYALGGYKLKR